MSSASYFDKFDYSKVMIFAKKSLGQNFLISPGVVSRIVSAGDIVTGETVIEIGPGKGVLTKALLDSGAHVRAIEKDDRLIPVLQQTFAKEISEGKLELIHGDVLESEVITSINSSGNYKVIANIPYYITGQIIRTFLSMASKPSNMILMVQKEVATRIIARDNKESILSLSVKAYAKPELVMNVSRGNFFPVPNVDSAVIKLSDIQNPFVDSVQEERFFEIVKTGFAQKRKKLSSNLENVFDGEESGKNKLAEIFENLGLEKNIRAEDVPLEKWIELTRG